MIDLDGNPRAGTPAVPASFHQR